MEKILWLYSLPYNPDYPIVCYDERPCFLIEHETSPIPMKQGNVTKHNHKYKKNGSCALLAAIEPLTGQRLAGIYDTRKKKDYADFMKKLAAKYPNAKKIRVIQDNLNTHNESSFYENMPADEAFKLAQRFEFYYTPIPIAIGTGSWLNMIEVEFAALAKQSLNDRIPTKELLEKKVLTLVKERQSKGIKIVWQFTVDNAREKLNRHYNKVNEANVKL